MATIDTFLERNRLVVENHTPLPTIKEARVMGAKMQRPAIISCCDPRCHPEYFLGLDGVDALVIRNAGGRVTSHVLTSLVGIDAMVGAENRGGISELAVIHHTDCGVLRFEDEILREVVVKRGESEENAAQLTFGGFSTLEQGVKEDLAILRNSKWLRPELAKTSRGYIYDIVTGKVTPVQE